MTARTHTSSRPDGWSSPRATVDPAQRFAHYGELLPMEMPAARPTLRQWAQAVGLALLCLGLAGAVVAAMLAVGW